MRLQTSKGQRNHEKAICGALTSADSHLARAVMGDLVLNAIGIVTVGCAYMAVYLTLPTDKTSQGTSRLSAPADRENTHL